MKKNRVTFAFAVIVLLMAPVPALAFGVELAAGLWYQRPTGNLSYQLQNIGDTLYLEDDMDLGSEYRLSGRLKIDMPLFIPNIYLMATPVRFDGIGSKNLNFDFGDSTFNLDSIDVEESGLVIDADIAGPFLELGVQF